MVDRDGYIARCTIFPKGGVIRVFQTQVSDEYVVRGYRATPSTPGYCCRFAFPSSGRAIIPMRKPIAVGRTTVASLHHVKTQGRKWQPYQPCVRRTGRGCKPIAVG
ncbi:MAG: hypothetical protein IKM35_05860 [Bacteroidaceae bacterium]|nr:hypothetical protein [Bacteroidaceae bacterium]